MLFNLNKETKKNLLDHYRRQAIISTLRKMEQRKKEKEVDKYNLEQKEMRQNKILELINQEKLEKKEKLKKEYNLMLQRTKGYLPKKNQLIMKNWGQNRDPYVLPVLNLDKSGMNKQKEVNRIVLDDIGDNNFEKLTINQKEKEILKQVDHMKDFLTDKPNEKELNQIYKIRKENRYHFYKDLLFSQYQDAINKDLNLYGTNDELIIKQKKKKNLTSNPYKLKNSYDFGASSLLHNPIINPENNYNYNKYINYQTYGLNPNNNTINNKNNLFSYKSMENLKLNNIRNDILDNERYNRNYWNNNISETHTIDLNYKKDQINMDDKSPLQISKYKFNIINKKNNNENNPILKRNISQDCVYPSI